MTQDPQKTFGAGPPFWAIKTLLNKTLNGSAHLAELIYLAVPKKYMFYMEYSKLVAVTGLPGLFELINSKTDGAIVRSLDDKSTRFVSSRIHNFSHLESIEIFTVKENVNLVDLFNAMDKAGTTLPDEKDAAAVKKYFEKYSPKWTLKESMPVI